VKTLSCIGLVGIMTFSASAISASAGAAAAPSVSMNEIRSTLTPLLGGSTFAPKDAQGSYVALHFLPMYAGEAKPHADAVKEFADKTPRLAGLRTLFVISAKRDWTTAVNEASSLIYVDDNNALANELQVGTTSPATVVFDPAGHELFRWTGSGEHDHLSYASFETRFTKASEAKAIKDYNLPKGSRTAIEGYDPVAYFNAGKPTKGDSKISSVWQGVTYQFASKANRDLFNADPEKYAPTYGGWCATAMGAKGTKVEIDPTNFKVKDGRLHLFYKDFFSDALKDWNKNEKEWEPKADANWKKTAGEDARHGTK
jgi:YHS domain-containing protein